MLGIVAYKDRNEQSQHEDRPQEIENDEEDGIALSDQGLRLSEYISYALGSPHNVCPALLRDNLEEDEEGAAKVVKVIPRVGDLSGRENIPAIRAAEVFADAIIEVEYAGAVIVTCLHPATEKIEPVNSEGNQQAQRDEGSLRPIRVFLQ